MSNAKSLTLYSIIFALCLNLPLQTSSFTFCPKSVKNIHLSQNLIIQPQCSQLAMAGGGWGKRTKEYTEDEFAKEGGDRRGFDAYELQEASFFVITFNKTKMMLRIFLTTYFVSQTMKK